MKKSMNPNVKHPNAAKSGLKESKESPPLDCDDCAICRGMKKAEEEGRELSFEELQALFQKQNTQN